MTTHRVLPQLARQQTLYKWRDEEHEYLDPKTWVKVSPAARDVETGRDIVLLEGEGYYSLHDVTVVSWGRKDIVRIGIRDRKTGEERWLRHHQDDRVQTYRRREENQVIENPTTFRIGDRVLAPSHYRGMVVTNSESLNGAPVAVSLLDEKRQISVLTSSKIISAVERKMT